jgi:hypothetical protein
MAQKPPIYYVYCSGKTGGMTIYKSLKFLHREYCLHTHSEIQYNKVNNYELYGGIKLNDLIIKSKGIYPNVYIIDSYREPIERCIASFFENIEKHLPNYENCTIEEMIDFFNKNKLRELENYHSYLESFSFFNISTDIIFDHEKKYCVTKNDNVIFIKLRLRDASKWECIMRNLVDTNFKLLTENVGESKNTGKIYRLFKKIYRVPKSYLDDLQFTDNTNLTEMKKMLSPTEIKEYFEKWRMKMC